MAEGLGGDVFVGDAQNADACCTKDLDALSVVGRSLGVTMDGTVDLDG